MTNQKGFDELFIELTDKINTFLTTHASKYVLEDFKHDFELFFSQNANIQLHYMGGINDEVFTKNTVLPEMMLKPEIFLRLILVVRKDGRLEQMIRRLMFEMNSSSRDALLNEPSIPDKGMFDTSLREENELSFLTQRK